MPVNTANLFMNSMKRFSISWFLPLILSMAVIHSCRTDEETCELIPISYKALYDSTSYWFSNFDSYSSDFSKLPIGIITSQTEELAVMERFLTADYYDNITGDEIPDGISDFAGERFHLLLDYANGPYSDYYRDSSKIQILRDVVIRNVLRMMDEEYYIIPDDVLATGVKEPVKFIVNVPDASGLYCQTDIDTLLHFSRTGVKSLSLISCGIKAALAGIKSDERCAIGVLSSPDLFSSGRYEELIRQYHDLNPNSGKVQIFQQLSFGLDQAVDGSPDFVKPDAQFVRDDYLGPVLGTGYQDIDVNMMDRYNFQTDNNALLVKKKGKAFTDIQLNSSANYARFHMVTLLEKHRRSGSRIPITAIVLGNRCDAFLLDTLKAVVSELYNFRRDGQYIYRNSISRNLKFIDPIECLVKDTYLRLRKNKELALNPSRTDITSFLIIPSPSLGESAIDTIDNTLSDQFKFGRHPGSESSGDKLIPFSLRYITPENFKYTVDLFPESIRLIGKKLY